MAEALAEWTVMVFLNGDNNLEPFGLQDFREMAQVGSTDQVKIIVQFDRNGSFATTTPQWTQALRFKVARGMAALPASALQDLGEVNMGDGGVLADFVQWSKQNFPARRYMLDIWDHGQGWRFFNTVPVRGSQDELATHRQFRRAIIDKEAGERSARLAERIRDTDKLEVALQPFDVIPAIPERRAIGNPVRFVSIDETSGDMLFNREIQDSLRGVLNGDKLDVIGFDACLMAMVETGFAMRDVAKVLAASEELEPGEGWNYADWLQQLVNNPTMDAASLGALLVQSYRRTYEGRDGTVTFSALDLSRMDSLANLIDALADEMIQKLPTELPHIRQARQNCAVYAPGYGLHGIDLVRFSDQLLMATSDASLSAKAKAVRDGAISCVLSNYAGPDRQGDFGSDGLAIYFPANRALFNTDPDHSGYLESNTVFPVEFVQRHHWDNFLQSYYSLVP